MDRHGHMLSLVTDERPSLYTLTLVHCVRFSRFVMQQIGDMIRKMK